MADYKPFLISEFKTGLYDYLAPWIRPQDAFEPLVNAYIYRGVLQKRNGSTIFGNQLSDTSPVMGIMQYQNESTGAIKLVVASTENAYVYAAGSTPDGGTFILLTAIGGVALSSNPNSIFWEGSVTSGTTAISSTLTFWTNLVTSSVTITAYNNGTLTAATVPPTSVGVVTDNGSGSFTGGTGIFSGASGTINYATGAVAFSSLTIGSSYNLTLTIVAATTGGYFTGNISNFFNWTNWQPTSSITAISTSYLYMTNNNDPVTLFDGTYLIRPIYYVDSAFSTYIVNALDVKTYSNRLLLIRPKISGEANKANQDVYFSALFNPFNFVGDIAGNGGAISAATGDQIISPEFLRDNLIIAFSGGYWTFQVSGVNEPPFIFRRINSSKNTASPYAGVSYDERVTNVGNTGFTACDGVNVQRYDIPIIDYYETRISQQYFGQDFSIRYDNLNQSWMLYPSEDDQFPLVGMVAPGSDETLVYNFLENTWATYLNSFPMTCLGKFLVPVGTTWAEAESPWEETQVPWNYAPLQATTPFLLGGDTSGNIYHLDNGEAVRDGMAISGGVLTGGTSFNVEILTTRWNPFVPQGQKTQFGYIDVYYSVSSLDPANPIQVTFNFYLDNSNSVAASRILTFDGSPNNDYAFKRIYCNLTGEFIRIGIDPDEDAPFQIVGFVLWARPAGRLTP